MQIDAKLVAVVSGGASGLGAATAARLAGLGAKVTLLDRDAERGPLTAAEIGGRFIETDVTDPASIGAALAQVIEAEGALHVAVSCAGIAPGAKTVSRGEPHDPALFARAIAINLTGTFNLASQAAALMAKNDPLDADGNRGVIVNTASVAAFEGQIGQISYAASKGGVAAMTLPMARDLAALGIRVNAIAPGLFRTPMVAGLPPETQESLGAAVPFPRRLGDPSEFAALVLHIIANPMMNGSVLRLDGAIRMGPR